MDQFIYKNGELYAENVPVARIAAEVGTPTYIYSRATLLTHYRRIAEAFAPLNPLICYSIKSCGNINLVRALVQEGSGMDVTSGGELFRALQAGCDPKKIVFAGVGKTDKEINEALDAAPPARTQNSELRTGGGQNSAAPGIGWFNIESEEEFWNLDRVAGLKGVTARGALRINPDIENKGGTHQKTFTGKKETKFGVDIDRAANFFRLARQARHARLNAIHLHIGSPIKIAEPYADAIAKALALIDELAKEGIAIDTLDIGGGFAAFYEGNEAPPAAAYAQVIVPLLKDRVVVPTPSSAAIPETPTRASAPPGGAPSALNIILEPGRSISCNAGILLAQVQYTKHGGSKKFIIINAAMNDLIRPTLYESYHFIWPAKPGPALVPPNRLSSLRTPGDEKVDVVGPICESGDYLAKDRYLPALRRSDLVAIFSAGAYGMSMASNYNARPRAAEILVDGDSYRIIRRRETYEDLIHGE